MSEQEARYLVTTLIGPCTEEAALTLMEAIANLDECKAVYGAVSSTRLPPDPEDT